MELSVLFLTAVGLSMDAFAVSLCTGLSMKQAKVKSMLIVGLYFGFFQAAMPLIGFSLGYNFADKIQAFDHWIAFFLLAVIGINMIKESFSKEAEDCKNKESLKFKDMLPLSLATSIDALAVGVSFSFLKVDILPAVIFIGVITFLFSFFGVKIGNIFGVRFKSKAEIIGGIILIIIGLKILLEHMGILDQL